MRRCRTRSPSSAPTPTASASTAASAASPRTRSRASTGWSDSVEVGIQGAVMDICKAGAEHIKSLRDGRAVYIDGELVDDVTTHRAFRNSVASAAGLYDFQAAPENIELMTFAIDGGNH